MGLRREYIDFIESAIANQFEDCRGLRMLELGNQLIRDPDIECKSGKEYFSQRGFDHVSVDLNGLNGALVRDLRIPKQFSDWHDSFHVLTNAGTSEHVEPFESQYDCFSIMHYCIKPAGIAIHLIPDIDELNTHGTWRNHCQNYYSKQFFESLADNCGYELLENTTINGLRCAVIKKLASSTFMSCRADFLAGVSRCPLQPRAKESSVRTVLRNLGIGKALRLFGLR